MKVKKSVKVFLVQHLIFSVDKSIEDGSNPIKAWMNLDERRTALLHFARSKYLAKHAS